MHNEGSQFLEEQASRIGFMFSMSIAASFFFLDVMNLCHRGWKVLIKRIYSEGRIHWRPLLLVMLEFGLLVALATLSQWISDLELLSVSGCAFVLLQLLVRTESARFFGVDVIENSNTIDFSRTFSLG